MTTDNRRISNRPRPLSDMVPALTKDVFGRKNVLFGKMMAQWAHIAGDDISSKTTPVDLKFSKKSGTNDAVLHLAVQPAYALEFSYQKMLLIERLNVFFGYPAIRDIKIIQNSEIMNKKSAAKAKTRPVTLQEQQKLDALVSQIKENDLQTALKNLGKAILSRQNKNT
jgi:hypothetical protein